MGVWVCAEPELLYSCQGRGGEGAGVWRVLGGSHWGVWGGWGRNFFAASFRGGGGVWRGGRARRGCRVWVWFEGEHAGAGWISLAAAQGVVGRRIRSQALGAAGPGVAVACAGGCGSCRGGVCVRVRVGGRWGRVGGLCGAVGAGRLPSRAVGGGARASGRLEGCG